MADKDQPLGEYPAIGEPLEEFKGGPVLDVVRSNVVVHDGRGRIIWSNPAAERLLGSGDDSMVGAPADSESWVFLREDGTRLPPNEYPVSVVWETGGSVEGLILGLIRPLPPTSRSAQGAIHQTPWPKGVGPFAPCGS
jgi:hypothetical protein